MRETEYLLIQLAEEASEVAQAACKALRFGLDDTHPETGKTAAENLEAELDELLAISQMLHRRGTIGWHNTARVSAKTARVGKYMAYSMSRGILEPASNIPIAALPVPSAPSVPSVPTP